MLEVEDGSSRHFCAISASHAGPFHACLDCDSHSLHCTPCIVDFHSCSLLHRLKTWNGTYFEDGSLANAGLVLNLGHNMSTCREGGGKVHTHLVTVIDVNGLHNVRMSWCRCYGFGSLASEMFRLQWLPATLIRPGTAFTFRVMKLFQMLSHVARTSAWEFCMALLRITDNVQPDLLPVSEGYFSYF
ncbi:hypothetical protein M422DRAFT_176041 [Sphaerobolus stellatus SS14]|uniref:CxC2-like cysteine cluster KDZ transposase-associated domain-containing protein n=1 Tax=Sphaerobolus stellatus (strain SS14) TaxID=990650 RepID=A0A0C9U725_SPHS4|nr:hypothetical protein M422DRAFT_176041 [Sphaerobolus stellatus SS14]